MNKKPDIHTLIIAVKKGERLSDLSKKWQTTVSALRNTLIREGIDYRHIIIDRKVRHYEQRFNECLKLAREKGRVPTVKEFRNLEIPRSRIGIYVTKLRELGFERKSLSRPKYSDDELLKELYRIYKKIKMTPSTKHIVKYSDYVKNTYINRFGSIRNAVRLMKKYYFKKIED